MSRAARRLSLFVVAICALSVASAPAASSRQHLLHVTWMKSYAAPGTPSRFNKVGVLKIGPRRARNVLVFEPGTSAGAAYLVPFAEWLVRRLPGWQVWSVERRENLLEDQGLLTKAKQHKATPKQVLDYYLGWLLDSHIKHHVRFLASNEASYAKSWGLDVAMRDLRVVIRKARRLGGKVVLSGHSLGGGLVTAYATWSFHGRPGADDLAGLVFDDGASFRAAATPEKARGDLAALMSRRSSPWAGISGGLPAPLLGLFTTTGALAAVLQPNRPSLGAKILPSFLRPPAPLSNLALLAWNTNVSTSRLGKLVFAILAHEGEGISRKVVNGVHSWNQRGALTPPTRYATMLSGRRVAAADGLEWYFPYRLTLDLFDGLNNGIRSGAQQVLGLHATMGRRLPKRLLMYAFGAALGKGIVAATRQLARQSHIPQGHLTLVSHQHTYAHNDPAGAYPRNAFFNGLVTFLRKVAP